MAQRNVHYEAAFEDYLRAKGLPYVAVDEAKKAIFGKISLKSFDFVVYSSGGANLLVDIKGRKFPDSIPGPKRGTGKAWENWITRGDLEGLTEWEKVFGEGFMAVLIFAYWLQGPPQRAPFEDVHVFRKNYYAFAAIPLTDYMTFAKPRSRKWQTMAMPAKEFARQAKDILEFL
ncbi:MAG: HYExAFE family protein [Phycisphaerae bacterium]|nr:HYExAFE family protein [Phycisphaerae bacterium]